MLAELTARSELSRLKDPRLFREQAYVGGKWTAAQDGEVMHITNPATGAKLGVVPALGVAETEAAIAAAAQAFPPGASCCRRNAPPVCDAGTS